MGRSIVSKKKLTFMSTELRKLPLIDCISFIISNFIISRILAMMFTQACVLMDKEKHIFLIQKTAVTIGSNKTVKKTHRFLYTNKVNKNITKNPVSEWGLFLYPNMYVYWYKFLVVFLWIFFRLFAKTS